MTNINLKGDPEVYNTLQNLNIKFIYNEHPPAPTVEIASQYWKDLDSSHCKNLFFRNHKGNRHFLVILDWRYQLNIKDLEQRLKQGKLTFASEKRLYKYMKIKPGSVSPFGLIHDNEKHIKLFIDENLKESKQISFHPNDNTVSLVISTVDFQKYIEHTGNSYEYLKLYE